MHIPDGFLDPKTAVAAGLVTIGALAVALPRVQRHLPPAKVPLLGLTAAFVFAAQMLNFPVGGGTSGHLVGRALAPALLGPAAAVVVLTAVLVTQCFLFADGGVTALGANALNMAVLAPVVSGIVMTVARRHLPGARGMVLGAAFAGWASVVIASLCCAGQLALSGTAPWSTTLPAMALVHMVIGAGEGLITALVLAPLLRARPELLDRSDVRATTSRSGAWLLFGIAAFGLALFVAPFASPLPDGLEHVAEALGFADRAHADPAVAAPLPDYVLPGLASPGLATAVAGAIGTAAALLLSWLIARALVPHAAGERA
jgi:cobalt/nickel transport system permease protein